MLEYLVQTGNISEADGLLATWFHRANSKEDMYKALMGKNTHTDNTALFDGVGAWTCSQVQTKQAPPPVIFPGDTMILEADVTLMGYGTPDEKPVPIMAHPPDIYSDNALDEWLDAVLASGKGTDQNCLHRKSIWSQFLKACSFAGIKLDFKALESLGLSLDLLKQKESNKGINRPVWLNADILRGPNVPSFVAPVNGSRYEIQLDRTQTLGQSSELGRENV